MGRLTGLRRLAWPLNEFRSGFCNLIQQRGLKFQVKDLKWVYPKKNPVFHASNSGDLAPIPVFDKKTLKLDFQKSEEIKTANEDVKKIFSLEFQLPKNQLLVYTQQLVDSVKRHEYDNSSPEARIATLTAKIRFFQSVLEKDPKQKLLITMVKEAIEKRNKFLRYLRMNDYKRFEWLLEKLDIKYKPIVQGDKVVTRKKSLLLLARLRVEKAKEKKLADLKKSYDEQKVPFLEKKIKKLKWIKEMEEKNNFPQTVTDAEIEECMKKIEKVKLEVAERMRIGYERKIHPYFIEPYHEKLLLEKERKANVAEKEEINS